MKKYNECYRFCHLLETIETVKHPARELGTSILDMLAVAYGEFTPRQNTNSVPQDIAEIERNLINFAGEFRFYKKIFDPFRDEAAVDCDLIDDLMDIYRSCKQYVTNKSIESDAEFQAEIKNHLIHHIMGASHALYLISYERGEV